METKNMSEEEQSKQGQKNYAMISANRLIYLDEYMEDLMVYIPRESSLESETREAELMQEINQKVCLFLENEIKERNPNLEASRKAKEAYRIERC